MRYFELTISGPGGDYILDPGGLGLTQGSGPIASSLYTAATAAGNSQLIGQTNPNALQIEFDLPVLQLHQAQTGGWIRLWGVGLKALGQVANLNRVNGVFKTFTLKAGMSKGLPLANPAQSGIIAQGSVFQAFGNWTGVNQHIDLILQPGPIPPSAGIKWEWNAGQPIKDAIAQTIAQAMPGYTQNINVADGLLAPNAQPGWYPHFSSWASAVRDFTIPLGKQLFGPSYQGVQISVKGNTVNVSDGEGPTAPQPKLLSFQDIIGQPTWVSSTEIAFATVVRADIDLVDQVKFPTGIMAPYALTSPSAAVPNVPASSSVIFQGAFGVNDLHHYGSSRQSDAAAWNSTFKAVALGSPPAAAS